MPHEPFLGPPPPAAPQSITNQKRKLPAVCWGQELSGRAMQCELVQPKTTAFRQRFCAHCQGKGIVISSSRVRMAVGEAVLANQHAGGAWNSRNAAWPEHRVVNQTAMCKGPKLVILRDEIHEELTGLASLSLPPGSFVAFRVGKTLQPVVTYLPPDQLPLQSSPRRIAPPPTLPAPTPPVPAPLIPALPTPAPPLGGVEASSPCLFTPAAEPPPPRVAEWEPRRGATAQRPRLWPQRGRVQSEAEASAERNGAG